MTKSLAIIGCGTLGQQIAQYTRQTGSYEVVGFFDDFVPAGTSTAGGPVLGSSERVAEASAEGRFEELFIGIGYEHFPVRQRLFETLASYVSFATFVHPAAYVDVSAKLGEGTFISPGCVVDTNVVIEENVFIYLGCVLGHDTVLRPHSILCCGGCLAGQVRVGERCLLGIGTTVSDGVNLVADVRTGAGTVVVRDADEAGTYVGVPARRLGS